jgi:hypothetical protein
LCNWLHKARGNAKQESKQEVERELTGRETERWEPSTSSFISAGRLPQTGRHYELRQPIPIEENRFGFEAEITVKVKVAKRRCGYTQWASVIGNEPTRKARKLAGTMACGQCGVW